ncbi:protein translocase subunit SecF [bacterium]|nr:protein translocase subunit SecF [bacterium]|tara:strand:+ start:9213 stop:10100 length:888 start_codon:yes stop_codon:yes gene_type:complete
MNIIANRKIFFTISGALIGASLLAVFVWGIPLGIDFKGGALLEVEYTNERPAVGEIEDSLQVLDLGGVRVQETGDRGVIIRTRTLVENEHGELLSILKESDQNLIEKRFTSIGPVLGEELRSRATIALLLTSLVIILFIAYVFRHVSHPVKSWKYGVVAIIALLHDVLIPTGMMAVLGKFQGAEVDALFVTALLAILGLSVNDTIVVFDRVRENLTNKISKDFAETVNTSLNQTIARSINTSLTTLLVLGTLFFMGPESTQTFALILIVGLIAGTYSSIFLASPLLVTLEKRQKK